VSNAPTLSVTALLQRHHELGGLGLPQWEELIRQARRTNLLARLACCLEERDLLARVPLAPRVHLEAAMTLAAAQADAVRREVEYVRNALAKAGIDIVLLKGAAYLMAGLPAARGRVFSDIDILVPLERLREVEVALKLHGWVTTHHSAYDQRYYRKWMHELPPLRHVIRMAVLDVHHAILPRTARLKPASAKLLAASRPIAGEDRLRILAPTDLVLHSMAHLFHNEEFSQGLRDLADLDSLLRHFGGQPGFWEQLPDRAVELDLSRPLYYGLRHARRLFGTPVPRAAELKVEAGRPTRLVGRLMDALYECALRPVAPGDRDLVAPLARQALFVRAHWLRMPPLLLAYHLTRKALVKSDRQAEAPTAQPGQRQA
jgi:hypothetical protein